MNYTDERICSIALTLCTGIGALTAHRLVQVAGSAAAVFSRREELARTCPDIQPAALKALDTPGIFARAEQELDFADKHGIACLTLQDDRYPTRLRQCEDAPLFLLYSGTGNLNSLRVVSMVGTRNATDYGRQWCNSFIRDLAALCPDLLVVSGLAYGIDIASHRAALAHHVPTVAVLAHGLDRIYPAIHRKTATEMLAQGGLLTEFLTGLTEFLTGTEPERYNFLSRNRIVAGMADAVIVVESGRKGGSLITATLAEGYHRDCFAVPGRATDEHSAGCNRLIRDNKAAQQGRLGGERRGLRTGHELEHDPNDVYPRAAQPVPGTDGRRRPHRPTAGPPGRPGRQHAGGRERHPLQPAERPPLRDGAEGHHKSPDRQCVSPAGLTASGSTHGRTSLEARAH